MSSIPMSRLERFNARVAKSRNYREIVEEKASRNAPDPMKNVGNLLRAGDVDEDAAIVFTPKGMTFLSSLIEGIIVKNMVTPQKLEELVEKVVHKELTRLTSSIATAFHSISEDMSAHLKESTLKEVSTCSDYVELMRGIRVAKADRADRVKVALGTSVESSPTLRKYEMMVTLLKEAGEPVRITDLTRMTEERYGVTISNGVSCIYNAMKTDSNIVKVGRKYYYNGSV